MELPFARRLQELPPYLFVEVDRAKRELAAAGHDVINLSIGDPDLPTPDFIVDALREAAKDPANHHYALDAGLPELRREIARWYLDRFHVKLDPETEVLPLIGSKEGIAHFPLAVLNPGDVALIPDPCYPPYRSGTILAGGVPHSVPLRSENGFLPILEDLGASVLSKARLLFLNYPNNPTAACATREFFEEAVRFAEKRELIIVHDAAYSEVAFDGFRPMSFLEIAQARQVGAEFHSLSKTLNMTGWRIGFVCGNAQLVQALGKVKSHIDSGIFQAIQIAGIRALQKAQEVASRNSAVFEQRRNVMVAGLKKLGFEFQLPKATFYMWVETPRDIRSADFCMTLLKKAHVVVTPGSGFGSAGEGYFRIALTTDEKRLREALDRIARVL